MDPQAGSTRVVPVVLPLLHGPQNRRRRPADSTLAGDRAARGGDSEALRTGRSRMSEAPAAGRPSLGIRQPEDIGRGAPSALTATARQSRYFTNTTSLRFSLYSSSSTFARTVRIPNPPGRSP